MFQCPLLHTVNFPVCFLEISDNEITEYYQPKDLRIGNTIFIYGRKFLLLDCDKFTRQYFNDVLREPQDEKLSIKFAERKIPQRVTIIFQDLKLII